MGTSWTEIITNYAMVEIDDVRLQEESGISPAQFLRRMSLYMNLALPLLNRPPELVPYLQDGLTIATYADANWTSNEASLSGETTIDTGITDFGLFSCVIREETANGYVTLSPYTDASYDAETGVVTFPQQTASGTLYVMDFYNDGSFAQELSPSLKRLLGLAVAFTWDERFSRNWLNMQMKIHDSEFNVGNEATYMREVTARQQKTRAAFFDELWKYEQDVALKNVSGMKRTAFL